jgi:hypothetical protein
MHDQPDLNRPGVLMADKEALQNLLNQINELCLIHGLQGLKSLSLFKNSFYFQSCALKITELSSFICKV